jgi:hypothetical protein|tara:strand:- start:313 stop:495 length:183 start_codon:yes stop_codon:yes gene_type:complete
MSNSELDRLRSEHNKLHTAIERMLDNNQSDENKLIVMKKHKLWLKDKITTIETKSQFQNI